MKNAGGKVETLDFQCKGFKSVTDAGTFVGYASTYGNTDLQDDVIEAGAFAAAINSQGSGVTLLWNHDGSSPIGKGRISDSKTGLVCHGSLLMNIPAAQTARSLMVADIVKGLSIGFTIDDPTAVSYDDAGTRHIKSLHLYEISATCFPANQAATITSVKSMAQVERFLRTERARVLKNAAAMDDEMDAHLRAIHQHVLSMLEPVDEDEEDVDDSLAYELSAFADELKALASA
jgi:HK97 family phage prohead protease